MKRWISTAAFVLAATPAFADDCRHTAARQVSAPAAGVQKVEIIARAGSLRVIGGTGAEVRAEGEACVSDRDYLEATRLEMRRAGSTLIIEATTETARFVFGTSYASLPFTVHLPASVGVEIRDGSGSIEVENTGALSIDDGSGSIEVRGVRGPVRIEDGSGEMTIRDVTGDVRIDDGSGSIEIRSIRGSVVIDEDGSGSIDIAGVTGNVIVEDDGSGSIDVQDVGGDFEVRRDGSGGISSGNIRGKVLIPRD